MTAPCPLCTGPGGLLLVQRPDWRVIRADEPGFPAFYRVIWTHHVAEWSDLHPAQRQRCMAAVVAVERALRDQLQPDKINLAALGNLVPHLHWHVVARFRWDSHFPAPIWAAAQRDLPQGPLSDLRARLPELDAGVVASLADLD